MTDSASYVIDPPLRGVPDERVICRHCSGELMAVAEFHGSVSMAGLRWFQWRHVTTGKGTCAVTYDGEPYDEWEATRRIEKAERAEDEAAS